MYLLVATGSEAQFYLLRPQDLIQAACAYLPANLTQGHWQRYLRDEPYRKTCPTAHDNDGFAHAAMSPPCHLTQVHD